MSTNPDSQAKNDHQEDHVKVQNLGQLLKEKREALGLTIEQIHQETKIAEVCLQAFENNVFDHVPNAYDWEIVYLKSYLLKYAKILGLDPAWVEEQAYDSTSLQKKAQQERISQIVSSEVASSPQMRNMTAHDANFSSKKTWTTNRIIGILVVIVIVIVAVVFGTKYYNESDNSDQQQPVAAQTEDNQVQDQQQPADQQQAPAQDQQATPAPTTAPAPATTPDANAQNPAAPTTDANAQNPQDPNAPATDAANAQQDIPKVGLFVSCKAPISFVLYTKERHLETVSCTPEAPYVLSMKADMSINFLNKSTKDVSIYFNGKPQTAKNLLNLPSWL